MKNLKPIMFIIAAIWTAIFIFSFIHNASNKRHVVTHFQETELQSEMYKVDISPAIAWNEAKGFSRIAAVFFLIVMWMGFVFVATDLHLKWFSSERSDYSWFAFTPMILSIAFFLGNYSSIQSSNYVGIKADVFKQWELERKIEQKGANTWKDADDDKVLYHLFDGKQIIK